MKKVIDMLSATGAPLHGFSLDDEVTRAKEAKGCRVWPGYIQVTN